MALQLGIMIAGAALGYYLGTQIKMPNTEGPRLEDLKSGGPAVYGDPIPIGYGNFVVGGKVIWSDVKKETVTVTETGGKGSPSAKSTTYSYTVSFAVLFHEGEIQGIRRLWLNNNLVYDVSGLGDTQSERLGSAAESSFLPFEIFYGTEDQAPSSVIEAVEGAGNTPAYLGYAYGVFEDLPLDDYGNSHPEVKAEIVTTLGDVQYYIVPVDVPEETPGQTYPAPYVSKNTVSMSPKLAVTGDDEVLVYNLESNPSESINGTFILYDRTITRKIGQEDMTLSGTWTSYDPGLGYLIYAYTDTALSSAAGSVFYNDEFLTYATTGTVALGEGTWTWTDPGSTLGYSTVCIRLNDDVDPNTVVGITASWDSRNSLEYSYYKSYIQKEKTDGFDSFTKIQTLGGAYSAPFSTMVSRNINPDGTKIEAPPAVPSSEDLIQKSGVPQSILAIDQTKPGIHWIGDSVGVGVVDYDFFYQYPCTIPRYQMATNVFGCLHDPKSFSSFPSDPILIGRATDYELQVRIVYGVGYRFFVNTQKFLDEEASFASWDHSCASFCGPQQSGAIGRLSAFSLDQQVFAVSYVPVTDRFAGEPSFIRIFAYNDAFGMPVYSDDPYDIYACPDEITPNYSRICGPAANVKPRILGDFPLAGKSGCPDYIWIHDDKILIKASYRPPTANSKTIYVLDGTDDTLPLLETIDLTANWDPTVATPGDEAFKYGFCVLPTGDLAVICNDDTYTGGIKGKYGLSVVVFDGISNTVKRIQVLEVEKISVEDILNDLCDRAGIVDYDFSELSGIETYGLSCVRQMSIKKAMEYLMNAYNFNIIEAEWQIKGTLKGGSSESTITIDEMGAKEGLTAAGVPFEVTREKEHTLPKSITFQFLNVDADYETGAVLGWKGTTDSRNKSSVSLPVVMDATEALQACEVWMQTAWRQQTSYKFPLNADYFKLLPGDIVTGHGNRMIIDSMDLQFPGIVDISAIGDGADAYISSSVHGDISYTPQTLAPTPIVDIIMVDCPNLFGMTDTPSIYVVGYCKNTTFPGASLFRSMDQSTWEAVMSLDTGAVVGKATTALGDGSISVWDRENTVTVDLISYNATLSSDTEINCINGANTAVMISGGQIEIFSFQTVTHIQGNQYQLSMLLRGRRGTDNAVDKHSVGATFILISNSGAWRKMPVAFDEIGEFYYYRSVANGGSLSDTKTWRYTIQARNIYPWGPCHIEYEWDDLDFVMSWEERPRYAGTWANTRGTLPTVDQPEAYGVELCEEVWDAEEGEYLPRVIRCFVTYGSTTVTYTEADQITDLGEALYLAYYNSTEPFFSIRVYQISKNNTFGFPGVVKFSMIPLPDLWTPAELTSTAFWIAADDAGSLTLDSSDKVISWKDKINGDLVENSDPTTRPEYQATGLFAQPTIYFDLETEKGLANNLLAIIPAPCTEYSMFTVTATKNLSGNLLIMSQGFIPGQAYPTSKYSLMNLRRHFSPYFNTMWFFLSDGAPSEAILLGSASNAGLFHGMVYNGAGTGNTGRAKFWRNGDDKTDDADYQGTIPASLTDPGAGILMGSGSTYASSHWIYTSEIIVTTSALSTSDVDKVNGYLMWKYGQQASLPTGHTYESEPPRRT